MTRHGVVSILLLATLLVGGVAAADDATNFTGVVTEHLAGRRYLFVQERPGTRGWRVSLEGGPHPDARFQVGDLVTVKGLLEPERNRHTTRLFWADVEKIGHDITAVPSPRPMTGASLHAHGPNSPLPEPDWYGDVVTVIGRILDINRRETLTHLLLAAEGGTVSAEFPIAREEPLPPHVAPDAIVRVTGPAVYSTVRTDGRLVAFENINLLVPDAASVKVLQRPPFWTPLHTLFLVGILLALLGLGSVWVFLLRRTVARTTARLEETIRAKVRDRVAAEAVSRERLRLSHDLHDDFQQLLASCTFRLAAATNFLERGADRATVLEQLGKVEDALAHTQAGLRAVLWSLNEEAEGPSRLSELFRYAAGRLAQWNGRVDFSFTGEEPQLSRRLSGALLMVLQEAIGNALRHGHATHIHVEVSFAPGAVALRIADDGCGFQPPDASSEASAHLGLTGMAERIRHLSGTFAINSTPGQGATVDVRIPL